MHAFASFPDHRAGVLCRSGGVDGASAGPKAGELDLVDYVYCVDLNVQSWAEYIGSAPVALLGS